MKSGGKLIQTFFICLSIIILSVALVVPTLQTLTIKTIQKEGVESKFKVTKKIGLWKSCQTCDELHYNSGFCELIDNKKEKCFSNMDKNQKLSKGIKLSFKFCQLLSVLSIIILAIGIICLFKLPPNLQKWTTISVFTGTILTVLIIIIFSAKINQDYSDQILKYSSSPSSEILKFKSVPSIKYGYGFYLQILGFLLAGISTSLLAIKSS